MLGLKVHFFSTAIVLVLKRRRENQSKATCLTWLVRGSLVQSHSGFPPWPGQQWVLPCWPSRRWCGLEAVEALKWSSLLSCLHGVQLLLFNQTSQCKLRVDGKTLAGCMLYNSPTTKNNRCLITPTWNLAVSYINHVPNYLANICLMDRMQCSQRQASHLLRILLYLQHLVQGADTTASATLCYVKHQHVVDQLAAVRRVPAWNSEAGFYLYFENECAMTRKSLGDRGD